ncbi:MAG: gliding motility-associated C-terminal domain-containing protein [Bacteroidetes bacterium]|nr:gliding motility-associated C-terminal domain-containing protein [Bacteroidota bacterium]
MLFRLFAFFCCSLLCLVPIQAQLNSLQTFEVETWYDNHLAVTNDHELFLASEMKYPQSNFKRGVYLIKIDSCNQIVWKKILQKSDFALNVHDIQIMENGDLLLMGITDFKEVFLIRLTPNGQEVFARRYSYSNHDFNYTLDTRNNQIMIFGNNLFADGTTQNYIMLLDENGNIIWNRNFLTAVQSGEALFCSDGGFLCHSGNVFYKTDAAGNLDWARLYPFIDPYIGACSNIIEGDFQSYYFSFYEDNVQRLVKINSAGQVSWIGEGTRSHGTPGDILLLPNGILWANTQLNEDGFSRPVFALYSESGSILKQWALELDAPGYVDFVETLFFNDDKTIAAFATIAGDNFKDLYFRTSLTDGICGLHEINEVYAPLNTTASTTVNFTPIAAGFVMSPILGLDIRELSFEINDLCLDINQPVTYEIDTLLLCGEDYSFESPSPQLSHIWSDGYTGINREISQPGIYEVEINDCSTGFAYILNIDKEPCLCDIQFPSAFSPNGDGLNDTFEPVSDCGFLEFEVTIYSRWGDRIYHSTDSDQGWNGFLENKAVPEDTYVYVCKYRADNGIGTARLQTLSGEVLILR